MMWTAEIALNELWETLDLQEPMGQIRQTLKAALQKAYSNGYAKGHSAAEYNDNSDSL